jgi:hypothetical protein
MPIAMAALAACVQQNQQKDPPEQTDPCGGIIPASVPEPTVIADAPFDILPFRDPIIGDAAGALFFVTSIAPVGKDFSAYVYNPQARFVADFTGSSADTLHPKALPQPSGFQILQGITPVFARLDVYASDGTLMRQSPVHEANRLVGSVDPSGGTLIVSQRIFPNGQRTLDDPWFITVQRFDSSANARGDPTTIAADSTGGHALTFLTGTVTTTGWALVAWGWVDHPLPTSANVNFAWLSPAGAITQGMLGTAVDVGGFLDVAPLAGGGAAIAATLPDPPGTYNWIAKLGDGDISQTAPAWLTPFLSTRVAIVRHGLANAIMAGAPSLGTAQKGCPPETTVSLISKDGQSCGSISLPVQFDAELTCLNSTSTAAVGLDGTVIVRTYEQGVDANGESAFEIAREGLAAALEVRNPVPEPANYQRLPFS